MEIMITIYFALNFFILGLFVFDILEDFNVFYSVMLMLTICVLGLPLIMIALIIEYISMYNEN